MIVTCTLYVRMYSVVMVFTRVLVQGHIYTRVKKRPKDKKLTCVGVDNDDQLSETSSHVRAVNST